MRKVFFSLLLIFLTGGTQFMCSNSKAKEELNLAGLLPGEILGWTPSETDQIFDQETIFDYINGAGEVYRAYRFKLLLGRRYARNGQPDIIADVFDMGSARNAFGVFTHDLDGEDAGIGQGSVYKGGLLSFWKGRIFASLFSEEETEEAREAVLALGKAITSLIAEEGKKPGLVALFPGEHLVKDSVRYFFSPIILNYHFFVADENILFLNKTTEAALAVYTLNDQQSRLLIVRYAGAADADKAKANFIAVYMPDAVEPGIIQTENGTWTAAKTRDSLMTIVFESPTKAFAQALINNIHK